MLGAPFLLAPVESDDDEDRKYKYRGMVSVWVESAGRCRTAGAADGASVVDQELIVLHIIMKRLWWLRHCTARFGVLAFSFRVPILRVGALADEGSSMIDDAVAVVRETPPRHSPRNRTYGTRYEYVRTIVSSSTRPFRHPTRDPTTSSSSCCLFLVALGVESSHEIVECDSHRISFGLVRAQDLVEEHDRPVLVVPPHPPGPWAGRHLSE